MNQRKPDPGLAALGRAVVRQALQDLAAGPQSREAARQFLFEADEPIATFLRMTGRDPDRAIDQLRRLGPEGAARILEQHPQRFKRSTV